MGKLFEGMLLGKGLKFAVVVSRFNEFITRKLLEGAQDALLRHGVDEEDIDVASVPGSFEIPLVAKSLAQTKRYDAVICLGTVIRGATPHFEYIAAEVTKGIAKVGLDTGLPISYGIIKSHNGLLAAKSGSNGALFSILLPVKAKTQQPGVKGVNVLG